LGLHGLDSVGGGFGSGDRRHNQTSSAAMPWACKTDLVPLVATIVKPRSTKVFATTAAAYLSRSLVEMNTAPDCGMD
jgi:hypothetical protein